MVSTSVDPLDSTLDRERLTGDAETSGNDHSIAKNSMPPRTLSSAQSYELMTKLKARFEKNKHRHEDLEWVPIQAKLEGNSAKLRSLFEMERTGGEPDVIRFDEETGEYVFCDCAKQSPKGRRSICYDREAQESRKNHPPENNAIDIAAAMGIDILSEDEYRALQQLGPFDTTTSSWIETPPDIRELGGALFGDFRYGHVFIYHNGAQSYYAARGFRGRLRV